MDNHRVRPVFFLLMVLVCVVAGVLIRWAWDAFKPAPAQQVRQIVSATESEQNRLSENNISAPLKRFSGAPNLPVHTIHSDSPPPNIGPPPEYFPRDSAEWQGMRVDMNIQPPCSESANCGLARACIDGKCGPCMSDHDCNVSEICVLEHCVNAEDVECQSKNDCAEGELCILSGYSTDVRNNEDMTAKCKAPSGGNGLSEEEAQAIEDANPIERVDAPPRTIAMGDLMDTLRNSAADSAEGQKNKTDF